MPLWAVCRGGGGAEVVFAFPNRYLCPQISKVMHESGRAWQKRERRETQPLRTRPPLLLQPIVPVTLCKYMGLKLFAALGQSTL